MARIWEDGAVKWLINKCKNTFLAKSDFKEAKMGWGGQSIANDISPVDAAMSSFHSANRAELCNPAGVTIEYSTDAGATWVDYGATDNQKRSLFSANGNENFRLGKNSSSVKNTSADVRLRVTMNATKMGIYTSLKKILIHFSTDGAKCKLTFEYSLIGSESAWKMVGEYDIAGWPGWNSYSGIARAFGGSPNQTSQIGNIRMTFAISAINSNFNNNACLCNILLFGTTAWRAPSFMAKSGHLYSWDVSGNATFPAAITATKINGHTIQSDVPANAKFTDTTYSAATASANGLMSAEDKAKLDGLVAKKVYGPFTVATSAWSADGSRYKAVISVSGVTANDIADVYFNADNVDSYELKPYCTTGAGIVTIYAGAIPGGSVTVEKIVI